MSKQALCLQTIFFHESDRAEARRLGKDLFNQLTRPLEDPLAYGAGIPVAIAVSADAVDLEAADIVVLLPVLGKTTFNFDVDNVLAELRKWHERLGPGHVLPIPISTNWRNVEARLPGKQFLTELYSVTDARKKKSTRSCYRSPDFCLSRPTNRQRLMHWEPLHRSCLYRMPRGRNGGSKRGHSFQRRCDTLQRIRSHAMFPVVKSTNRIPLETVFVRAVSGLAINRSGEPRLGVQKGPSIILD